MRANGKRAGEWPDEEYHKRKKRLSEAEANGLGWIPIAEIAAKDGSKKLETTAELFPEEKDGGNG